jgi:hypothetical protein
MNMKEEILREHSKAHCLRVAAHACTSKENFTELMKCFMSDDYRLAQRAAWSVSWAARKKPAMIVPHIKTLVAALEKKNVHDAVIRNSLRVLEAVDIPERFHGKIMNACFGFITAPGKPVAFKAFSLTILERLAKIYPEIRQELKLLIEENWDTETAAFRSRGKKILAAINKASAP